MKKKMTLGIFLILLALAVILFDAHNVLLSLLAHKGESVIPIPLFSMLATIPFLCGCSLISRELDKRGIKY
jgi:hypothetical protein